MDSGQKHAGMTKGVASMISAISTGFRPKECRNDVDVIGDRPSIPAQKHTGMTKSVASMISAISTGFRPKECRNDEWRSLMESCQGLPG